MEQTQELLQKWAARARRLHLRMEITGEGLTLGAGTILAGMAHDERGRPRLALADEPRDGAARDGLWAAGGGACSDQAEARGNSLDRGGESARPYSSRSHRSSALR